MDSIHNFTQVCALSKGQSREMRWIKRDETSSTGKVCSTNNVLDEVNRICNGIRGAPENVAKIISYPDLPRLDGSDRVRSGYEVIALLGPSPEYL